MSSKKAAKTQAAEVDYQIKDIVLAKVKGYPPWPAMVVDPENVAKHVKKERPNSKKTVFYCVRFFPAGDYSWAVAKDMSRLQTHEIEAYINEPSKKNGELKRGYEIALNPGPWEEELVRKQEEAEAAAEEEEGVDQLDGESDGEDEVESDADSTANKKKKKSQAGKKRKRDSATAEDKQKKRKSVSESKRRPLAGTKKASKSKASSTEQIESEDGGAAADGNDSADPTPKKGSSKANKSKSADETGERAAKKGKKDKDDDEPEDSALANDPEAQRVKEWRHKLQRGFLSKEPPNAAEMPTYDQIFQTVENKELTIDYLQFSKIGKVMRRIAGLDEVPRDDEFHFKDRAISLVHKWQAIIQAAEVEASGNSKANGTSAEKTSSRSPPAEADPEAKTDPKPAVNGTTHTPAEVEMTNGDAKPADSAAKDDAMDMSDS